MFCDLEIGLCFAGSFEQAEISFLGFRFLSFLLGILAYSPLFLFSQGFFFSANWDTVCFSGIRISLVARAAQCWTNHRPADWRRHKARDWCSAFLHTFAAPAGTWLIPCFTRPNKVRTSFEVQSCFPESIPTYLLHRCDRPFSRCRLLGIS